MLHFRLRTLLIAVAVLAVPMAWVGRELKIVRDRKELLQNVHYAGRANYISNPRPHSDLPFYRLWIGDVSIERIDAWNEVDAKRADSLFPELRELYFVDTDNYVKNYDGDRRVPISGGGWR